jgi:hypothetical protein
MKAPATVSGSARSMRMTQAEKPPSPESRPADNPSGKTPQGVPQGMEDHEPKARPTSERHETETASRKS